MKIAWINGSPKPSASATALLEGAVSARLAPAPLLAVRAMEPEGWEGILGGSDRIVLAFPLYVDGIPGHLLDFLQCIEPSLAALAPKARLYALVNCGFFEGKQARLALEMARHFCAAAGIAWGGGLGIGAGGMLGAAPVGQGPLAPVGRALDAFCQAVQSGAAFPDQFVSPAFPRRLYIAAAHMSWRKAARKAGLTVHEIKRGMI